MKWSITDTAEGKRLFLQLNKETIKRLLEQMQGLTGETPEMSILLTPENQLNHLRIVLIDDTVPNEVLEKTKPWFNGSHTFPTVKVGTVSQPNSLGVAVGDGSSTGEKIG